MATSMQHNTDPLHTLELDPRDAEALADALAPVAAEHGMRAVWIDPISEQLASELEPEAFAVYNAFVDPLVPASRFAYMPLRSLVLCMARGAGLGSHLPNAPLIERTNALLERSTARMVQSAVLRPVLVACGESLTAASEATARSHDLFYNFGDLTFTRLGQTGFRVVYNGHHLEAEGYYLLGFYRGLLRHFGNTTPVEIERLAGGSFAVTVQP